MRRISPPSIAHVAMTTGVEIATDGGAEREGGRNHVRMAAALSHILASSGEKVVGQSRERHYNKIGRAHV